MRWLDGITDLNMSLSKLQGVGDGQGSLVCCSPWGCKGSDMTERLNKNNNVRFYAFMAIIAIIGYKNA